MHSERRSTPMVPDDRQSSVNFAANNDGDQFPNGDERAVTSDSDDDESIADEDDNDNNEEEENENENIARNRRGRPKFEMEIRVHFRK